MKLDKGNLQSLEWLVDEIEVSLKQAFEALDAYLKDKQDQSQIELCLGYIHQVHGTLKVAECYGAMLLAEEMEALVEAILKGNIASAGDASEVLVQAILKLPAYIRQIISSGVDQPATLIPLLNDLRAVQSRPLLSEGSLFSPRIEQNLESTGTRSTLLPDNAAFVELVKKLRQMYQVALLGLIRNTDREKNLSYIERVFSRLFELSKGTVKHPLWRVALAVHEGVAQNNIQLSVAVKSLLRSLDLEIRGLQQHGVDALQGEISPGLLKNLLYYIASSNAASPRILEIQESFGLDSALPAGTFGSADGFTPMLEPQAVESMASALVEEINSAKELASRYQQQGGLDSELLDELHKVIGRIADSLMFVGKGELATPVAELNKRLLAAIEQQRALSEDELADIAAQLVATESAVLSWGNSGGATVEGAAQNAELLRARDAVLKETRHGLGKVKEGIVEYISSQWDRHYLEHAPQLINEIRGALDVMEQLRPAAVLQTAKTYIESQLLSGHAVPDWQTLDHLADAITSIEYYLDSSRSADSAETEAILAMAEKSAQSLSPSESVAGSPVEPGYQVIDDAEQLVADESEAAELEVDAQPEKSSDAVLPLLEPEIEFDLEVTPEKSELLTGEPAPEVQQPVASHVDEEIVEIFIEEAAEVLENLVSWMPEWQADPLGVRLEDVRRGFHTLKGSGRMVEANRIGDLAWSIEQLLNRIIEKQVSMTAAAPLLVEQVVEHLPGMVTAYQNNRMEPDSASTDRLIASAEAMIRGEQYEELQSADDAVSELADDEIVDAEQEITAEFEVESSPDVNGPPFTAEFAAADSAQQEPALAFESLETAIDDDDDDLLQIFSGETQMHLEQVRQFIADAEQQAPIYIPPTANLQRALHTLKGSANMAGVMPIAGLANPLERLIKELHNFQLPAEEMMLAILADSDSWITETLETLTEAEMESMAPPEALIERIEALRERTTLPLLASSEDSSHAAAIDRRELLELMAGGLQLLLDDDHLFDADRPLSQLPLQPLSEECAQLSRAADRASEPSISELSTALQQACLQLVENPAGFDAVRTVLIAAREKLLLMIDTVAADQELPSQEPELTQLRECQSLLNAPAEQVESTDSALSLQPIGVESLSDDVPLEIVLEASADTESKAVSEQEPTAEPVAWEESVSEQSSMEEGSETVVEFDVQPESILAEQAVEDSVVTNDNVTETPEQNETPCEEQVEVTDAEFSVGEQDSEADEVAVEYEPVTNEDVARAVEVSGTEPVVESDTTDSASIEESELEQNDDLTEASAGALASEPDVDASGVKDGDADSSADAEVEVDEEILAIFLEEADELLEEIDDAIQQWKVSPGSNEPAEILKRALHTFKGGARMADLSELGEMSHQFESWIVESGQGTAHNEAFFARLQSEQDQLHVRVKALHGKSDNAAAPKTEVSPSPSAVATELAAAIAPSMAAASMRGANTDNGPQEMVKVRAALLDSLVNMAGETSISRGRIEQQISEFSFALDEMNTTIRRLQDQVRRLGIETEAQVMFRREQIEATSSLEGFDPLEMDRYSQLQQLSRALMESASDLQDLNTTLKHKSKDAETLLVQQGRINTDLQEGLMRSRMVPFSRVVPRLRRIVRQVSSELNKQVELQLLNVEGEMDRSVLEKMLPALDHMLRNAIDHGIESAEQRLAGGKPEQGTISIGLSREGGDIVIKLGDDGRGLNIDAIRKQAIRRGLMAEDANLSDHEVVQFILESGFSTSEQVSHISGRGVGLDVVNADVRQLGGTIAIRSEQGVGSEFSVRLPFTVSINRALMIEVGEDLYALPLSTIDGVVRMKPRELEEFYRNPLSRYKYGDSEYGVRYLGSLLHDGAPPRISSEEDAVPLVLVRSEQQSYAVQVDRLIGSSEIVVKTLGAQFSVVPGLSGATVLGDGRVVVILDLLALLRTQKGLPNNNVLWLEDRSAAEAEVPVPVVMVVDDSVTVRKVTSRFLEREGFHVITAKDGADAMRLLRDHDPDVMLLDIEMPRMDGFEVASRLRSMSRFESLPVIMITSRTGDKHRQRAMSLGVNHYLGKPYREEELLESINELIGRQSVSSTHADTEPDFEITF